MFSGFFFTQHSFNYLKNQQNPALNWRPHPARCGGPSPWWAPPARCWWSPWSSGSPRDTDSSRHSRTPHTHDLTSRGCRRQCGGNPCGCDRAPRRRGPPPRGSRQRPGGRSGPPPPWGWVVEFREWPTNVKRIPVLVKQQECGTQVILYGFRSEFRSRSYILKSFKNFFVIYSCLTQNFLTEQGTYCIFFNTGSRTRLYDFFYRSGKIIIHTDPESFQVCKI